jgi:cation:H+ antiporter
MRSGGSVAPAFRYSDATWECPPMDEVRSSVQFFVGLAVLCVGAQTFLSGAVALARSLRVPPLLVGLTVVSFGTSAPELAVNLSAALGGSPTLALGNVVGSNLANLGLILGAAALIRPLTVQMRLLRGEVPIMIGAVALLWLLTADLRLGRGDALILLAGVGAVTGYVYRAARREPPPVQDEFAHVVAGRLPLVLAVLQVVGGLVGLVLGAELMVRAAVTLARTWGLSELVIGLTVVAIGTSLPELAATTLAARRGEADIAVGNVVGSNIFNVLLILGATALIEPLPVAAGIRRAELPVLLLFSVALVPIMLRGRHISRVEGAMLVAGYGVVLGWQLLRA